jgi:LacI family transcriptional regulator
MMAKQRVTMKIIAAEAGVSVQTVSRVVNDRPDVAPATRQRVREIIDRLGYRPSNIARSLIQGRSCTLGVVGYGLEYVGPARVLMGIERRSSEMGYTLLLSLIRQPEQDGAQILRDMLAHHVDGVLWAVTEVGANRDWAQEEMARLSIPVVFLHTDPRPNLTVVDIDNRHGGWLATRHLLDQGCQEIGLITGPTSWWAARERKLGWRQALEGAGLEAQEDLVVEGDWSAVSGERGLQQLLSQHPTIDAVFACNDQIALGVLTTAHALHLNVPQDLAVVGFDDIPEAPYFYPPLSTIHQDLKELGQRAVSVLGRLIERAEQDDASPPYEAVFLPPYLVERASSHLKKGISAEAV